MVVDRGLGRPAPETLLSIRDFLESLIDYSPPKAFCLSTPKNDQETFRVRRRTLSRKPFCTLRNFEHSLNRGVSRVLVVAPLSGQYAVLLRDVVAGLLPDHSVAMTDWRNAHDVAIDKGKFDLEDNITYVVDFITQLGPDVHVLAVCQSAVPVLAAIALLAAEDSPHQPRSLILMGGLIDTRVNPTRIGRIAQMSVFSRFQDSAISYVPPGFAGVGRRIYPATVQRAGLLTYISRHVTLSPESALTLRIKGDPTLADPDFLTRLLTLMDLPAELYLQNISAVLQEHALPRGTLTWHDRKVEPGAISQTALMTLEGEYDDISGAGQTHAAQELCHAIPSGRRRHVVQPGIGHFGMYAGNSWFERVLPEVCDFIRGQS